MTTMHILVTYLEERGFTTMYRYNRSCIPCEGGSSSNNRKALQKNIDDLIASLTNQTQSVQNAGTSGGKSTHKPADGKKDTNHQPSEKKPKEDEKNAVVFKHDKDGLSIHITIYNTNNNANEGSEAGLKQKAENGGQISGKAGKNANQGGQIAAKCGHNANQDSAVSAEGCAKDHGGGCKDGFCKDCCCEGCGNGAYDAMGYENGAYDAEGYENAGYEAEGYENGGYAAEGYAAEGYQENAYPGEDEAFYPNGGYSYEQ